MPATAAHRTEDTTPRAEATAHADPAPAHHMEDTRGTDQTRAPAALAHQIEEIEDTAQTRGPIVNRNPVVLRPIDVQQVAGEASLGSQCFASI